VDREYDLFETVNGEPIWRCSVIGLEPATAKLKELAAVTRNELRLMHLPSNSLIAQANSKADSEPPQSRKAVAN
jgi:hypothetical protein